jgi:PAS domain S-box-containing protein
LIGVAVGTVAAGAATGIGLLVDLEGRTGQVSLYVLAVALATFVGGFVPGLATAVMSFLALTYFFLSPSRSLALDSDGAVAIGIFVVTSVVVAYLLHRERRTAESAERLATERQELLDAAAASEQRLRSIITSSVDGIVVIDERGAIQLFNPASERLFGYRAEEVVGRNVNMLMPPPYAGEHDGYLERYLATGEARIIGIGREVEGRRKDGSVFPFDLSVSEVRLGRRRLFTGVVHDLSGRKRSEEALRASEEQLRIALAATATGTWSWEIGSNEVRWSESLGPLHGLPLGAHPRSYEAFLALVHPEDRPLLADAVRRAMEEGSDYQLEFRVVWPDGSVHWLETRAHVVTDGRAPSRLIGLVQDVSERKRRDEDGRMLAAAAELLSAAHDHRATLRELARLIVTRLADSCCISMLADNGTIEHVALAHVAPDQPGLESELAGQELDGHAPRGLFNVLRTGRSELYESIPAAMLDDSAPGRGQLEMFRDLRPVSAIIVPLASGRRVLGAMTLMMAESARRYGAEDLAYAEELARRTALAIENLILHESERRARRVAEVAAERSRRLQELAASLAEALTPDEVAAVLVREGTAALGARGGVVYLFDPQKEELVMQAHTGYPDWFLDLFRGMSIEADSGAALAARERRALWYSDPDEYGAAHPAFATGFERLGYKAVTFLPLLTPKELLGVVAISFLESRAFPADEREHLTALASQCALALERSLLYEHERRVAATLQQSLLPQRLPADERVQIAVRYRPGSAGLEVGGDWYDVIPTPGGRLAITVGDVVGRGVEAAASMTQLRNALRAYALEGHSPPEALERVDNLVEQLGEGDFATVVYLELDPEERTARFSSAGHPPLLLLTPDRGPVFLEGGRSLPLGVHGGPERGDETVHLEPGATLVLYTDGLIERRGLAIGIGLERLQEAATVAPTDVEELLDHLLSALGAGEELRDDVAVLAVRLAPVDAGRLELRFDASPAALASVRTRLGAWLEGVGVRDNMAFEVLVACGEACANAIEHPVSRASSYVRLTAELLDGELLIRVRDDGGWREPAERTDRGFGLRFMRGLMDTVDVGSTAEGTEVVLRRRLREAVPA